VRLAVLLILLATITAHAEERTLTLPDSGHRVVAVVGDGDSIDYEWSRVRSQRLLGGGALIAGGLLTIGTFNHAREALDAQDEAERYLAEAAAGGFDDVNYVAARDARNTHRAKAIALGVGAAGAVGVGTWLVMRREGHGTAVLTAHGRRPDSYADELLLGDLFALGAFGVTWAVVTVTADSCHVDCNSDAITASMKGAIAGFFVGSATYVIAPMVTRARHRDITNLVVGSALRVGLPFGMRALATENGGGAFLGGMVLASILDASLFSRTSGIHATVTHRDGTTIDLYGRF
jgi:hypothetical protein